MRSRRHGAAAPGGWAKGLRSARPRRHRREPHERECPAGKSRRAASPQKWRIRAAIGKARRSILKPKRQRVSPGTTGRDHRAHGRRGRRPPHRKPEKPDRRSRGVRRRARAAQPGHLSRSSDTRIRWEVPPARGGPWGSRWAGGHFRRNRRGRPCSSPVPYGIPQAARRTYRRRRQPPLPAGPPGRPPKARK